MKCCPVQESTHVLGVALASIKWPAGHADKQTIGDAVISLYKEESH